MELDSGLASSGMSDPASGPIGRVTGGILLDAQGVCPYGLPKCKFGEGDDLIEAEVNENSGPGSAEE